MSRTAHKLIRTALRQSSGAKVAALAKAPFTWNALTDSNSLPSSNFKGAACNCHNSCVGSFQRSEKINSAVLSSRTPCVKHGHDMHASESSLGLSFSVTVRSCKSGGSKLWQTSTDSKLAETLPAKNSQKLPASRPSPPPRSDVCHYGHAACSAPLDERPRHTGAPIPTGAPFS